MNKKEEWMKEEYQDMIEAIESQVHRKKTISSKKWMVLEMGEQGLKRRIGLEISCI